jgi:hypothetical protein
MTELQYANHRGGRDISAILYLRHLFMVHFEAKKLGSAGFRRSDSEFLKLFIRKVPFDPHRGAGGTMFNGFTASGRVPAILRPSSSACSQRRRGDAPNFVDALENGGRVTSAWRPPRHFRHHCRLWALRHSLKLADGLLTL